MKVAILGYDTEGKASYDYFTQRGDDVTICDQNTEIVIPEGADSVLGKTYLDNLDRFDLLVRTAGLPPRVILDSNPGIAEKITTQVNEFLRVCPTKNIIGVTGTKGKGTTSTLIAKMLKASGKEVSLGGNIGIPVFELLGKLDENSWVVLELSSFQLIDCRYSPHIAVCLMVVPEHLNWHKDIEEYYGAKAQLCSHQTPQDLAIYYAENDVSKKIVSSGKAHQIPFFSLPGAIVSDGSIVIDEQVICRTDDLKLLGAHNWQNACAAVTAVWQVTQDVEAMRSVLTSFSGMEHRLELVRELDGVKYYDDSFGTTPETAIVAIQAFDQPKVVILGGSDKGASYDELARTVVAGNVRRVLLIGDEAESIGAALENAGYSDAIPGGKDMVEIVANAKTASQPGDVVLLSTACASFGMFKDYKDRGLQFKSAVQSIS